MLNTNPSQKINSWKYFSMLPLLLAFVFMFQVKVQAQINEENKEKLDYAFSSNYSSILTKNTSDKDLKELETTFTGKKHKLIITNVKRNKNGEIIAIKMSFDTGKTYNRVIDNKSTKPIDDIKIYVKTDDKNNVTCGFEIVDKSVPIIEEKVGNFVFDKFETDDQLKSDEESFFKDYGVVFKVSKIKRNEKGEITQIKLAFDDKKGNKGETEQIREIPIRPIFFQIKVLKNGKNAIGFFNNHEMKVLPKNDEKEDKISLIESLKDDAVIYVDGELYDKENLEYLDVNGLESIKVLTDAKSLEKYNVISKKEVIVIETNWTTKKDSKKTTKEAETKSNALFSNKSDLDLVSNDIFETLNIERKEGENVIVILNEKIIEGDLNLFTKSELEAYTKSIAKEKNLAKGLFVYQNKKLTKIEYVPKKIDDLYEKKY